MYSENRRNAAVRRSNDEFLRQLIGGELQAESSPTKYRMQGCRSAEQQISDNCQQEPRSCSLRERSMYERQSRAESSCATCNENDHYSPCQDCPTVLNAPALAMVYSPRQCWRGVLSPHDALAAGSLFAELILPLEQNRTFDEKEACGRKCAL